MPSMRLLQFAGKAAEATNVCAYNCSFVAPEDNYRLEWEYQIFGGYNGMSLGIKIKSYG